MLLIKAVAVICLDVSLTTTPRQQASLCRQPPPHPPPHPHFPPDCQRPLVCSNSGAPFSPVEYMCWIFLISLCDPLRALLFALSRRGLFPGFHGFFENCPTTLLDSQLFIIIIVIFLIIKDCSLRKAVLLKRSMFSCLQQDCQHSAIIIQIISAGSAVARILAVSESCGKLSS